MTMTTYKTIEVREEEGVFSLILNRQPLNILNIAMLEETAAALREAHASDCGLLVIKAAGKAFSAGADVGEHLPDMAGRMLSAFHEAINLLYSFEGISIAAVQGAALGGGCEVAITADLILASAKAKFGQPEIQLGVFPPVAMVLLPILTFPRAARELVLSGEAVCAEEAKALGLVNKIFEVEKFEAGVDEYLARFKAMSRSSLRLAKRSMRRIHPTEFKEKLAAAEEAYLKDLMATADGKEGCAAFLEKRKPVWKHS